MIVAVDTGGTKTLVAVFDTDGKVAHEHKFPTPKDVHTYVTQLKVVIDELTAETVITCLSVALPGTIIDGVMVWAGNLNWHDTDIKSLLKNHYDCPIIVENDANLAGLAEARVLKDTPSRVLYATVSTGIGVGIITNGAIDPNYSINESGRIVLWHDGSLQKWESFASGKAIHEKYGKLASEIEDTATWEEIGYNIALGFLTLCPTLRPEVIVIGGSVGSHFDKFSGFMQTALQENMEDMFMPKQIVEAAHPEKAVIYGCYYHAIDRLA